VIRRKKNRYKALLLIVLILLLSPDAHSGQEVNEKIVSYNGLVLSGTLNDLSKFNISIFLKQYKQQLGFNTKGHFWGTDGNTPKTVVQNIVVTINKRNVKFPARSYSDLANVILPNGLYVMQASNIILIYLKGGDGAGAYTVVYEIASEQLTKRTIQFVNAEGEIDQICTRY
jgi:hypothetical protein